MVLSLQSFKHKGSTRKRQSKSDFKTQIRNYRGQVLYYSLDDKNKEYSHGWLNAQGMNDADSEFRMSLYHNNNIRLGFIDKTILITNGLDDDSEEQFQKDFYEWLGTENAGGVYHINTPFQVEDIKSTIAIETVQSSYDPKNSKKYLKILRTISEAVIYKYLKYLLMIKMAEYLEILEKLSKKRQKYTITRRHQ